MGGSKGRTFVVIGAGPAGLTAAYELCRAGHRPVVLEKEALVGGLARTEQYKGFRFDMGGHRFFTKAVEVDRMWHEVLGDQFLVRPRLSRIFFKQRFFQYPLKPLNALLGLGLVESLLTGLSYLRWQVSPYPREDTFEEWVTNRFGRRLFRTFFKTYTEKVWGIPCSELKAEWAAQRIKDLSFRSALVSMFVKPGRRITTLIEQFDYPRLGPGMMWETVRDSITGRGGEVQTECELERIERDGQHIRRAVVGVNGSRRSIEATDFISSMPITELVKRLDPPAPDDVLAAAGALRHRDFLTVCVIVDQPRLFPDNWIYVHDPSVQVGRIQNFKNWSPDMVPDDRKTSLGLEYFCNEGDELWTMADDELVALAQRELESIGLARGEDVEDGCVFRVPKSYPVYDSAYAEHLAVVREFVGSLQNLQTIGRNGLHRYDNQDHAMLTGMYAARNAVSGESNDLWAVNTEAEYHEQVSAERGRNLRRVEAQIRLGLAEVLGRIDRLALGAGTGVVLGLGLCLATLLIVAQGGEVVGRTLGLLSHYLPGYSVSVAGSFLGFGYGLMFGFLLGWLFALMRNAIMFLWFSVLRRRVERGFMRDLLEYI